MTIRLMLNVDCDHTRDTIVTKILSVISYKNPSGSLAVRRLHGLSADHDEGIVHLGGVRLRQ